MYRVIREIGRGGMGRVYEVEDTTIGKRYALKVLRDAQASSPSQVERLRLESRTLVRVAHANVVDVITAGVTADGAFFYVMEMLDGRSLRRVLKEAVRLPAIAALRVGVDVGEALAQAHAEGVVHRDVKPDNIFIAMRQMTTSAKLLDFGVAALLDNLRTTLRETGKLLGTPRYASPQQQRGEKAHPSMDIWALGYVLFEALVGHGPFRGRSLNEILVSVQSPEPGFRLSDFLQDVSPRLDDLLASMLEKKVVKRASSMQDVTGELLCILQHEEDIAVPLGTEDTTLESMLGLVNRTAPGDVAAKGLNEPGRLDADPAASAFFADQPGTMSRAPVAAGGSAENEDSPTVVDRAWGLLSSDLTAPVAPVARPIRVRPAAGVPAEGSTRAAARAPFVSAARLEDSAAPSVRSSRGASSARTPARQWLAPAIAFSTVLVVGSAAVFVGTGGRHVAIEASGLKPALPEVTPPREVLPAVAWPILAEPQDIVSTIASDGGALLPPEATPPADATSAPTEPKARPVTRSRPSAPARAVAPITPEEDEFKYGSLLNH